MRLFPTIFLLILIQCAFTQNITEMDEISKVRSYFQQMKNNINQSIDPCDDFYNYACGNWHLYNPLPDDKTQIDLFSILQDRVDEIVKDLIEEKLIKKDEKNKRDAVYKAAKFYESCLNEENILLNGTQTLLKIIEENGCWPALYPDWQEEQFDWLTTVAKSSSLGVNVLIRVSVGEDYDDSNSNILYIIEPDVGMYSGNFLDKTKKHILDAYKMMISKILQLLNVDKINSDKSADDIVKFETEIAKIIVDPNEAISINDLSHVMTIDKLQIKYPLIDWIKFLYVATGRKFDKNTKINLLEKNYFTRFFKLIQNTKSKIIMNYIMWRLTQQFIYTLDEKFQNIIEEFNDIIVGKRKNENKWKKCIKITREKLGLPLSLLYIENNFNDTSILEISKLFEQLKLIFVDLLKKNEWMDWRTKNYAIIKLNGMQIDIGYPKILKSSIDINKRYINLNINDNYLKNIIKINEFDFNREVNLLNRPVDKNEWYQHPIQINAAYDVSKNGITVNAAFIQLPIYSIYYPKSLLYGGLGSTLGHEITHGFDELGSLFDTNGNKRNWWSNSSSEAFQEKIKCMIEQYNKYKLMNFNINGAITNSENIADNGGIKESYYAYIKSLTTTFDEENSTENDLQKELENLLQLTDKQIFFLQYAQIWCQTFKPEAIENFLNSDIHAPGKIRVLGVLSNFNEFSNAFKCPLGSKMNPEHKCEVW